MKQQGEKIFFIDAYYISTSNWTRWVNCARSSYEQNVAVNQCRGKLYYMTSKDLYPGQEMLAFYGNAYAKTLNIDMDNYYS